jgi:uncharacterized LabA/DUF88 family protein
VRTIFLVDGFNLYHSLIDAERQLKMPVKWLSLWDFCASYLHNISRDAGMHEVHYFSALAKHKDARSPGVVNRHLNYIACLEATGVTVHLNSFKKRIASCPHCGRTVVRHEEKETDVMIAGAFLETMYERRADCVVLVSGDTDLRPAIELGRKKAADIPAFVILPYCRANAEIAQVFDAAFKAKPRSYLSHQLPNPCAISEGRSIVKPASW